jgi:hypothetical protein
MFGVYNIHTFIQSHSFNTFIRRYSLRPLSISSSLVCSVGEPPCSAEPRIELGPALQQADALPTEPRRTIRATPHHMLYADPRLDRIQLALESQSLSQLPAGFQNDYNYGLWPHLTSRLIYKSNIRSPQGHAGHLKN